MRRKRDAMGLRQRRDAASRGEATAVRQIELTDFARAPIEKRLERFEVCHALAGRNRRDKRRVDLRQTIHALGPAWFLQKVETIRIERFAESQSHRRRWTGVAIDHDINRLTNGVA